MAPQAQVKKPQDNIHTLNCMPPEPFFMLAQQMGKVEKVWPLAGEKVKEALAFIYKNYTELDQNAPFDVAIIIKHEGGAWGVVPGFAQVGVLCQDYGFATTEGDKIRVLQRLAGEDDGSL